ncbi:PQQ-dependent sugar dehydrogenase [Flavobacteriaceae bacterium TK19130]|nr:PQQ-dependent sugar dehydrogenase [Thermobacterium salinum]
MKKSISLLSFLLFTISLIAQDINIALVADGFSSPVDIENAGDDRLFIVEQGGRIKILNADGTTNSTPFLDISTQVSNGGEQGLLGLAFHPDYANNGFFYVNYTKTNGDTRVARFSVDSGDPDIAQVGSEFEIIEYEQPFSNHNGGDVAFGPDGYLYISSGDGGSGGDPGNRAQNLSLLLGKMLRLDVDGGTPYAIPADNPFVGAGTTILEEIWAYGLRNPWRFSFDSMNGDLWIGDVGQADVEEIDRAGIDEGGLNYGWRCYEGSVPFNTSNCPPMEDLTFPIAEYSSSTGSGNCSVTGGFVYRGSMFPDLNGLYFYGDVCSGIIGSVDADGNLTEYGNFSGSWVSFGEDINSELYIADIGGSIYRIEGELSTPDYSPVNFEMYPNPTSSNVNITLSKGTIDSVIISTLSGATLLKQDQISESHYAFSSSDFASGIYLVKIIDSEGASVTKKLVKN